MGYYKGLKKDAEKNGMEEVLEEVIDNAKKYENNMSKESFASYVTIKYQNIKNDIKKYIDNE